MSRRSVRRRSALERWSSTVADRLGAYRPTERQQVAVTLGGVLAVLAIGALDYVTGAVYSFAIFYLLPVALVAVVIGAAAGCGLALLAACVWVVAEELVFDHQQELAALWNAFGRFLTMCVVACLLGALRNALVRVSASEQHSRVFLATAAHQLRTPVAGLIVSAEALVEAPDEEQRRHLVENLVEGTDRTRRTLTSLLELSRLDQASPAPRREVDLAALCRREVESVGVRGRADAESARIEVVYEGPAECRVRSDVDAVREALSNVLDNAVRHAGSRVAVRLAHEGRHVAIVVHDDGRGVPAGSEERVFERFVSLDRAGGAGLGLAIARDSLRSVGGDVLIGADGFRLTVPDGA